MADISTAVSMARVPILGEDGRISDDYIPAAIGENVTKAEAAATRAESAKTDAETAKEAAETAKTAAQSAKTAAETAQKGAESAKTVAEAAKAAAEKAKADAESAGTAAANSAQDAQQSADAAKQSADAAKQSAASVADKFIASAQATTLEPGSQATASVENQVLTIGVPKGEKGDKGDQGEKGDTGTGVPEGGEPGQLLSKTEDGAAWVDPPSGNVLIGTLGPARVLSADDAYATTPRRLTVYGETRQNLWANPSGTNNGVTVKNNGNGSMTLSGTATSAASVSSADSYIIKPSTAYTLSMNAALTGASFVVTEYDAAGSQLAQHSVSSTSAASFTSSASVARCVMSLSVQSGQAVSGTYRVMLNEGSEAQPWCPPGLNSVGDDGSVKVVTAGKNLLPNEWYAGGIDVNSGDEIKNAQEIRSGFVQVLGNTSYYFTTTKLSSLQKGRMYDSEKHYIGSFNTGLSFKKGAAFKTPTGCCFIRVILTNSDEFQFTSSLAGTTLNGCDVQLELGSTATAYEPPNITTTPIDLQGHTLNSLPDGTRDELHIDGGGNVVLEKRTGVATYDGSEDEKWQYTGYRIGMNGAAPGSTEIDANNNGRCDTLPVRKASSSPAITYYNKGWVDIRNDAAITDAESGKAWLAANHTTLLYPLATPQTIPLPAVTLPTLPAPTVNVYADAESSVTGYAMGPDAGMEYERDVTIAFDKLQAQISATTVREATNG